MREIALKNSDKVAIVDDCDFERVSAYDWSLHCKGYAYSRFWSGAGYTTVYMHRLIAGSKPGDNFEVDHRDLNKLNNRRDNLRIATRSQNKANALPPRRKAGKTSRYKGVSRHTRDDRWVAHIRLRGKSTYLGLFEQENEAAMAYNEAATAGFGEFALLNKV